MKFNLRLLYLYLFSFVGLLIVVIGSVQMINLGLKTFVFKNADKYYFQSNDIYQKQNQEMQTTAQRQGELAFALSMIVVGLPLYLYHWKLIGKDKA